MKIQLTLMKFIFNTMIAANKETQINISPNEVINILKEGNKRFINGDEIKKISLQRSKEQVQDNIL